MSLIADEETLIEQLRDTTQRHAAFSTLVKAYSETLYWHIRRMVLSHDDANDILQNTFIKVDEEGAEAAAVTSVMLEATALGPPETKKMKIDRPFFYAIRENGSGNILFIGKR